MITLVCSADNNLKKITNLFGDSVFLLASKQVSSTTR